MPIIVPTITIEKSTHTLIKEGFYLLEKLSAKLTDEGEYEKTRNNRRPWSNGNSVFHATHY